jgi:SAM-dependent methyltransferase
MTMPKARMRWILVLCSALAMGGMWISTQAQPRTPDVIYVPTPHDVVAEMLRIAGVTSDDVVYDLGSGDGRVIIAAAARYGARGVGVDIDPQRVREGRANASQAGVADRVQFLEQDLFATDLREASVVTLYLLPSLNVKLRPKLLSELRPGTRVVSYDFDMDDWSPDQVLRMPQASYKDTVYYWVIPAEVAGVWRWRVPTPSGEQRYALRLQQRFQEVSGTISSEGGETPIADSRLTGDQLQFSAATGGGQGRRVQLAFNGRVSGNTVRGRVEVQGGASAGQYDWTAHRDADGATAPPGR